MKSLYSAVLYTFEYKKKEQLVVIKQMLVESHNFSIILRDMDHSW